jgi:integrase
MTTMKEGRESLKKTASKSVEWTTSKDGYRFAASQRHWKLNKDVTVALGIAADLPEPAQSSFRGTLQRYAEEMSARHTENMATRFQRYLRDTGARGVTSSDLLNWRGKLGQAEQWHLGGLKGFLLAWHDYGFKGISKEVVDLLEGWRIKGNDKGVAVISGCPYSGPYTDLEIAALVDWANAAVMKKSIAFDAYAYLMVLVMMARRPIQIAALRGKDLIHEAGAVGDRYKVNVPRAKQRDGGFRKSFRSIPVIEDLFLVLQQQHKKSVALVETALHDKVEEALKGEIPLFLRSKALALIRNYDELREALLGAQPDALHQTTALLHGELRRCARLSTARSERTGEFLHLSATRFRYTRGTKLRREGFGPFVIAELLDHSDIQNVSVYTENTAQEAVVINEFIGSKLAPYAQACMGTLVVSEREAIRGDDSRSRVPNQKQNPVGTCGNYGFCASGFRACYTCHHFQPWVDGPHAEVLDELYAEKRRTTEAGCATQVVNANDQLILAVEHCVAMCQEAKTDKTAAKGIEAVTNE